MEWVRSQLQVHFAAPGPAQVTAANFLTLDLRWRRVVDLLSESSGRRLRSEAVRVVCVDIAYLGNGDVLGDGGLTLYVARENVNRSVPLIPMTSDAVPRTNDNAVAASSSSRAAGDAVQGPRIVTGFGSERVEDVAAHERASLSNAVNQA